MMTLWLNPSCRLPTLLRRRLSTTKQKINLIIHGSTKIKITLSWSNIKIFRTRRIKTVHIACRIRFSIQFTLNSIIWQQLKLNHHFILNQRQTFNNILLREWREDRSERKTGRLKNSARNLHMKKLKFSKSSNWKKNLPWNRQI